MPHLGTDVAAFVDGQMSPAATRDAETHLDRCDVCAHAVRQQRLLKSRMSTVSSPAVSPDLLASLAGLAAEPPRERRWVRVRRSRPFRAGLVVAGASIGVVAAAWVVGAGAGGGIGDRVAPPFEQYGASFFGATSTATAVTTVAVSDDGVEELTEKGWPCHPRLAGDLERTTASYSRADDTIALTYTDGTTRLDLYEQNGWLDPEAVDGFAQRRWDDATVWVRDGDPAVVTWDDDGVVFTIVTDADDRQIRRAVEDLPSGDGTRGPVERVGDGLERMSGWASAA